MPRYANTDHGVSRLRSDGLVDVLLPDANGIDQVLLAGATATDLAHLPATDTVPSTEVTFRAPVFRPTKVWAVGYAYAEHSAEVGRDQDPDEEPILFLKATTSIAGPTDEIRLPSLCPEKVDYEGEIAVVISRRASGIDPSAAWDHVLGFTAANDVSARDVQRGLYNGGNPDPTKAKSFDTFTPLGPCICTPDEYENRDDVGLETHVDGELRQRARSATMRHDVAKVVAFASRFTALEPGDVILTGTPAGAGHPTGRFLQAGNVVRVTVEGVGSLQNTVVAPVLAGSPLSA